MTRSLCFGAGIGLLGLGAMRWRRRGLGLGGGGGGRGTKTTNYAFDPPPPPHRRRDVGGGVVDSALSALLGLGASLFAIESGALHPRRRTARRLVDGTTISESTSIPPPPPWISPVVPLVPGRSAISDALCGPLTAEFRKFPREMWRGGTFDMGIEGGHHNHMALYANSGWRGTGYYQRRRRRGGGGGDGGDGIDATAEVLGENAADNNYNGIGAHERLVLDSLQGFVINCERRARHEARVRKLRGGLGGSGSGRRGAIDAPVVIPDDGVYADEDMELDDIYCVDRDGDDYDYGNDDDIVGGGGERMNNT
jgi:hypothetical protein